MQIEGESKMGQFLKQLSSLEILAVLKTKSCIFIVLQANQRLLPLTALQMDFIATATI
jgi:hypothetical protein